MLGFLKDLRDKMRRLPKNVYYVTLVSFFMQISASIVYSTGTSVVEGTLISMSTLYFARQFSEGLSCIPKIFAGVLSDKMGNRKIFLLVGYGAMIFLKIIFALVITKRKTPQIAITIFKFLIGTLHLGAIYVLAQITDRVVNSLRDGARDSIISESTSEDLRGLSFGLRKGVASLGSIFGSSFAYIFTHNNEARLPILYWIAVPPTIVSTAIIWFLIKDVIEKEKEEEVTIRPREEKVYSFFESAGEFLLTLWVVYHATLGATNRYGLYNSYIIPVTYLLPIILLIMYLRSTSGFLFTLATVTAEHFILKYSKLPPLIMAPFFGLIYVYLVYNYNHYWTSRSYSYIENNLLEHKEEIFSVFPILLIVFFTSLGKINDSLLYSYAKNILKFPSETTILVFTAFYSCMCVFSFLYAYLLDNKKRKPALILSTLSLVICNSIFVYFSRINFPYSIPTGAGYIFNNKHFWISLVSLALYCSGIETAFSAVMSLKIKSKNIRATIFSLFYVFIGFGTILNALLIPLSSVSVFYVVVVASSLFAFISLLFFKEQIVEEKKELNII